MAESAAGRELGRIELPLEPVKVAELAAALQGEPGVVPPTATVLAAHHTPAGGSPNELIIAAAGLDQARVLLGELAWTYQRSLRPGGSLTGTVRLLSRTVRQGRRGGTLVLARGVTEWRDSTGQAVVDAEVTLIEPATAATPGPGKTGGDPPTAVGGGGAAEGPDRLRLSRTDIVRYAGAAGDFNPVHHDEPYARRLGYPGVFAMGLLPGGILAARAQRLLAPARLFRLYLRFSGQVWPETTYQVRREHLDPQEGTGPGWELVLTDPAGAESLRARAFPSPAQTGGC